MSSGLTASEMDAQLEEGEEVDVRALAQEHLVGAVDTVAEVMKDGRPATKLAAAVKMIEIGTGKPEVREPTNARGQGLQVVINNLVIGADGRPIQDAIDVAAVLVEDSIEQSAAKSPQGPGEALGVSPLDLCPSHDLKIEHARCQGSDDPDSPCWSPPF